MATVEETLDDDLRFRSALELGWPLALADGLGSSDTISSLAGKRIVERLRVAGQVLGNFRGNIKTDDGLHLADGVFRAVIDVLTDEMSAADALTTVLVYNLFERLRVVDPLAAGARYQFRMQETIRLADSLARFFGGDLVDAIGIVESVAARALASGIVGEQIAVSGSLAPQFLLSVVAGDRVGITPDQAVRMLCNPSLVDEVEISAGYLAPNGSITTWAMNTRTGAVTEYRNYAFNSFANFGNVYLGASDQGVHELRGDTDDGEDIIARLRSGYLQFGGTHLSRLKAAYISARGEGDVYLKIITADGAEYVYTVPTREMRSTKVHMGKGQRARYFAYELTTVGQDFDLDTIEFVPIVVQRRV